MHSCLFAEWENFNTEDEFDYLYLYFTQGNFVSDQVLSFKQTNLMGLPQCDEFVVPLAWSNRDDISNAPKEVIYSSTGLGQMLVLVGFLVIIFILFSTLNE